MARQTERIKEILDTITLSRDDYKMLLKDRQDFAFDSIYFRYAEAIVELSFFKDMEAKKIGRDFNRKVWVDDKLMHFYYCLEQWTHAHEDQSQKDKVTIEEAKKTFQNFAKIANKITGGV